MAGDFIPTGHRSARYLLVTVLLAAVLVAMLLLAGAPQAVLAALHRLSVWSRSSGKGLTWW